LCSMYIVVELGDRRFGFGARLSPVIIKKSLFI